MLQSVLKINQGGRSSKLLGGNCPKQIFVGVGIVFLCERVDHRSWSGLAVTLCMCVCAFVCVCVRACVVCVCVSLNVKKLLSSFFL